MKRHTKASYATTAVIRRILDAAQSFGIEVASFEALPDGTVRVMSAHTASSPVLDEFDRLDAAGLL